MKKVLLIVFALGFAVQGWGQNKQFNPVTEVKVSKDTLYVSGFVKDAGYLTDTIKLTNGATVFTNTTLKLFPTVSLITVPFKIRPKTDKLSPNAYSGLENIGVNVDVLSWQWDRYFATGKTSAHRVGFGLFFAPFVEELTVNNTKNVTANNKQLFASLGLSLNYSYNKLTFTFIPAGIDFATNSAGNQWVYNKKYWWGFGIGVDLKILEGIFKE